MTPEPRGAAILIADDDPAVREALARTLARDGYEAVLAADGEEALNLFRQRPVPVVLADLKMPRLGGLGLLRALKAIAPEVEVIMISGHGTVEEAVAALKEGAYDFVTKPFKRVAIERAIAKALEKRALLLENRALQRELEAARAGGRIIGKSPAMVRTLDLARQAAASTATVLVQGESGTGKELIAEAIHQWSPRADKPLVKVNCAAIPEALLESELFGHEKGAFTGAYARKEGRFELADGGTMFLDEIGDMSLATQAKLLRVLQSGEFERVGGTRTLQVDVRLVAATNRDLAQAAKEKALREDLFYRLNVITIPLPPLRERPEDIPLLARHFLQVYARRNGREMAGFTPEAMDLLLEYPWPGNVREMENAIERGVVLGRDEVIGPEDLPPEIAGAAGEPRARSITIQLGTPLEEVERRLIEETLRQARGDKVLAAKLLGIASRTIYRRLKEP